MGRELNFKRSKHQFGKKQLLWTLLLGLFLAYCMAFISESAPVPTETTTPLTIPLL